jgi:ketosteroid isomerase-like protein
LERLQINERYEVIRQERTPLWQGAKREARQKRSVLMLLEKPRSDETNTTRVSAKEVQQRLAAEKRNTRRAKAK